MSTVASGDSVWVLNGPNLNLLGTREPQVYGTATLTEIETALVAHGERHGVGVRCFQSNLEGEIVSRLHEAVGVARGIILNAAAYTHTSIAIADAIVAVGIPTIEVHLSNIYKREPYRHTSMIAAHCVGTIAGLGPLGYHLALDALVGGPTCLKP